MTNNLVGFSFCYLFVLFCFALFLALSIGANFVLPTQLKSVVNLAACLRSNLLVFHEYNDSPIRSYSLMRD